MLPNQVADICKVNMLDSRTQTGRPPLRLQDNLFNSNGICARSRQNIIPKSGTELKRITDFITKFVIGKTVNGPGDVETSICAFKV